MFGYSVLGIAWTWPLALHLIDGVIQHHPVPIDAGQNLWMLWWARYALLNGHNPFSTQYLFYPDTIDLFWQTLGLPNALMVFPVLAAFGPILAFNLIELLSFGLSGYFVYRIGRSIFESRIIALLSGFIFAFSPYHMQPIYSGSLEIAAIHWIALYVLMLMRALARPSAWNIVGAAVVLIVTTLSSHYYGLFCAVYTAAHVGLALLFFRQWRSRWRALSSAVAIGLLWIGLLIPFVWPPGELGSAVLHDWYERQVFHSAELIDFVAPNVLHPLWGDLAFTWLSRRHPFGPESGAGAGIVVYLLALWGVVKYGRAAWPWFVLTLVMAVLALGPELTFGGEASGVPLPFRGLDYLGPFRNSSRPSRIIAVMMLPLSINAGFGLQALVTAVWHRRRLIWSVAGGLIVAEYLVKPWNILHFDVDPFYIAINDDRIAGAILELPPLNDDGRYMVNQLCHGRPLVGGYLARAPVNSLVAYPSVTHHLWEATPVAPDIFEYDAASELATLGIRFVTLHRASLDETSAAQVRQTLSTPAIALVTASDQLEGYAIDPQAARPLLLPTTGWHDVESDGQRRWRWIGDEARARIFAPSHAALSLAFGATAYQAPHKLRLRLNDMLIGEFTVTVDAQRPIHLSFVVPPGQHELSFESEAFLAPDGRRLSLRISNVQMSSTTLATPSARSLEPPPVVPSLEGPPCE